MSADDKFSNPQERSKVRVRPLLFAPLVVALVMLGLGSLTLAQVPKREGESNTSFLGFATVFLGFATLFLWLASMLPRIVPDFFENRRSLRALFYVAEGLFGGAATVLIVIDATGETSYTLMFGVFLALGFLALSATSAWDVFNPVRRAERERRQKLLADIETLAEKDPNLYVVAKLVRDDIAISSRQSGRQGLLQNTFFFLTGLAIPYVVQYSTPFVQTWLNLR